VTKKAACCLAVLPGSEAAIHPHREVCDSCIRVLFLRVRDADMLVERLFCG
jgi:hypothetical protein